MTRITASRGLVEHYPENTLVAFDQAVAAGAERIELDVQVSADGELLVHHPYYLGTVDDGEGVIWEQSARYLRSLDCGSWYAPEFAGLRMPLLEEVFQVVGRRAEYELDLKVCSVAFLEAVVGLVERYDLGGVTEYTSRHLVGLAHLRHVRPRAVLGMFVEPYPDWMTPEHGHALTLQQLLTGRLDVAHLPIGLLTASYVEALHAAGITVHAANCNTESELRRAYRLGVDQLSTYQLGLALRLRSEWEAREESAGSGSNRR